MTPVQDIVEEHVEKMTADGIVITPEHPDRTESSIFRASVARLKADGHYRCWMRGWEDGDKKPDGSIVNLQAHHYGAEWSLQGVVDYDKLKAFVEEWDVYGYGRLMKNIPLTSVDDVRCLIVLDQEFHTGINNTIGNPTGIHNLVFPYWIMQKVSRDGLVPVPQEGQTIEQVEQAIDTH